MAKKNNKKRDNEHYYPGTTNNGRRSFGKGVSSGKDDSKTHAYFIGVGYGKGRNGEKHLGFRSAEERERFEYGVRNKDKHYIVAGYDDPDAKKGHSGFSLGSALHVIGSVLAWPLVKGYELFRSLFSELSKISLRPSTQPTAKSQVHKKPTKRMTAKRSIGKRYQVKKH